MAIHNQADAVYRYVAESNWGTTPTNPALTAIEINSGSSFQAETEKQISEGQRGDALARNQYLVGKSWSGTLNMDFRPSDPVYEFTRAALKSPAYQGLYVPASPAAQATNTAGSGTTFDIVLCGTTASPNWVSAYGAAVGAYVTITNAGSFNGSGTWRITAISTTTATNDTITVTGTGAGSVTATSSAATLLLIAINHAEYGTTDSAFTFEQAWDSDYMAWQGGRIKTMSIDIPEQGVASVSFGINGKDWNTSGVTLGTGSRGTTYATSVPYHNNNLALSMIEGGSSFTGTIVSAKFETDNGYRGLNGASAGLTAAEIMSGKFAVTGSIDVYFENQTMFNKALNHTETSLEFGFTNATTSCRIYMPKVYFQQGSLPDSGMDTDSIITMPFTAFADSADDIICIDFPGALS